MYSCAWSNTATGNYTLLPLKPFSFSHESRQSAQNALGCAKRTPTYARHRLTAPRAQSCPETVAWERNYYNTSALVNNSQAWDRNPYNQSDSFRDPGSPEARKIPSKAISPPNRDGPSTTRASRPLPVHALRLGSLLQFPCEPLPDDLVRQPARLLPAKQPIPVARHNVVAPVPHEGRHRQKACCQPDGK